MTTDPGQVSPLWWDASVQGLRAVDLAAFWHGQGLSARVKVYDGPVLAADPGACIVTSWLPGPGFSFEDMIDTSAVQVRVMGPQKAPGQAWILADMLDRSLTRFRWPAMLGGHQVVLIRRAGGRPSQDRVDNAERTHYVCTYLADVAADPGEATLR